MVIVLYFRFAYIYRYRRFTDLKSRNPNIKLLLAVGGWNHPWERFHNATQTKRSRRKLNLSIIRRLREYGFDGFDLDWEYPGNRESPEEDKEKFTLWAQVIYQR